MGEGFGGRGGAHHLWALPPPTSGRILGALRRPLPRRKHALPAPPQPADVAAMRPPRFPCPRVLLPRLGVRRAAGGGPGPRQSGGADVAAAPGHRHRRRHRHAVRGRLALHGSCRAAGAPSAGRGGRGSSSCVQPAPLQLPPPLPPPGPARRHLHRRHPPIIHRDVKSPNLLLDSHWVCKVAGEPPAALRRRSTLPPRGAGLQFVHERAQACASGPSLLAPSSPRLPCLHPARHLQTSTCRGACGAARRGTACPRPPRQQAPPTHCGWRPRCCTARRRWPRPTSTPLVGAAARGVARGAVAARRHQAHLQRWRQHPCVVCTRPFLTTHACMHAAGIVLWEMLVWRIPYAGLHSEAGAPFKASSAAKPSAGGRPGAWACMPAWRSGACAGCRQRRHVSARPPQASHPLRPLARSCAWCWRGSGPRCRRARRCLGPTPPRLQGWMGTCS